MSLERKVSDPRFSPVHALYLVLFLWANPLRLDLFPSRSFSLLMVGCMLLETLSMELKFTHAWLYPIPHRTLHNTLIPPEGG